MNIFIKKVCGLFILLIVGFQDSEQSVMSVLKIGFQVFEKAIGIFNTGLDIADFLDKRESDSGLTEKDLEKLKEAILQTVQTMVKTSETNIIMALEVGRLKDSVRSLRSSLVDLDYYLKAENGTEKEQYKERFLKRFDENAIVEIRDLDTWLTAEIPGLSRPLKNIIIDATKCNMTSIIVFEQFYASIISHAFALETVYDKINNISLNNVQAYWNNRLPSVQNAFDEMENMCIDKFEESVSKEILQNTTAEDLHTNSKGRYIWKWNDVFQYKHVTSYKWHYYISLWEPTQYFFWSNPTRDTNRIIVFGDKNTTVSRWDRDDIEARLQANTSLFQTALKGPNAAKDLGQAIGSFVNNLDFIYQCIIVFFTDMMHTKALIDPLSPAACVNVNAFDGIDSYHACVYPKIWNDFASYLNAYTEMDNVAVAAASGLSDLNILLMILVISGVTFQ